MKNYKLCTLFAALALGLTANTTPILAQDGPLKTAVDGTFAPHAFPDLSGGVQGFNVDLFNAVAERLNREIDITATQWSGILPGLQAGTYDFVAAPTTATEERAENLLFTEGYLNTDFQFLIKQGGPEATALEDFKDKTIAVNKGSAYDKWARDLEGEIGWTVQSFGSQSDAVQAVLSGRADATWAAKQNPQLTLSLLHSTGKVFSSPTRLDSPEMRAQIENAIECLKLDGTLAALHEKWFGIPPAPGSAAVAGCSR